MLQVTPQHWLCTLAFWIAAQAVTGEEAEKRAIAAIKKEGALIEKDRKTNLVVEVSFFLPKCR